VVLPDTPATITVHDNTPDGWSVIATGSSEKMQAGSVPLDNSLNLLVTPSGAASATTFALDDAPGVAIVTHSVKTAAQEVETVQYSQVFAETDAAGSYSVTITYTLS
jgi:hypothetical protein